MRKIILMLVGMLVILFIGTFAFYDEREPISPDLIILNGETGNDFWKLISYGNFNGQEMHGVVFPDKGKHTFTIDIVTNSGSYELQIKDSNGISVYEGNERTMVPSFHCNASGDEKYIIQVDGKNHNGSFDIHWE